MQRVYEAAGGREGLLRLASAWHARVLEDEVVAHACSHGYHPQHTERLAAYWAEALGGPTTYSEQYGNETGSPWLLGRSWQAPGVSRFRYFNHSSCQGRFRYPQ